MARGSSPGIGIPSATGRRAGRILLTVILVAGAFAMAGCFTKKTETPATLECPVGTPFLNIDKTYGMCAPPGWTTDRFVNHAELAVLSPVEGASDTFLEGVYVIRYEVAANVSAGSYATSQVQDLDRSVANFTLLHSGNYTLGGEPGRLLEYTGVQGGQTLHAAMVIAVRDSVAYIITYLALDDHEVTFQAPVETMLQSFRFLR